jgi:hypothetical protein
MTEKENMTARAAVLSKDFFDGEHCDSVLSVEEIDLDTLASKDGLQQVELINFWFLMKLES